MGLITAKSALRAALLAALVAFSGGAFAQQAPSSASQQIVTLDWEQLIPALLRGRIDIIMSGMTETKTRSSFL